MITTLKNSKEMTKEEKEQFLKEFSHFIDFMVSKEKADFITLKKVLGVEVNDKTIREARCRDIQRNVNVGTLEFDQVKETYLTKLCTICPEFFQLLKRLDQSYFSSEKRSTIVPEEIMTSLDYKMIFNLIKTMMK